MRTYKGTVDVNGTEVNYTATAKEDHSRIVNILCDQRPGGLVSSGGIKVHPPNQRRLIEKIEGSVRSIFDEANLMVECRKQYKIQGLQNIPVPVC